MQNHLEIGQNICQCNPKIYNQLRLRQIEYIQLIKDLYQENLRLRDLLNQYQNTAHFLPSNPGDNPERVPLKVGQQSSNGSASKITMQPLQIGEFSNTNLLTVNSARLGHARTPSFNTPENNNSEIRTTSGSSKNYAQGSLYSFFDKKDVEETPQPTLRVSTDTSQKEIIKIPAQTKFNKIFSNLLKSQPNIDLEEVFPQTYTEIEIRDNSQENISNRKYNPWNIKTNKSIIKDESRTSVKYDGHMGDDGISEYSELCEFKHGAQLRNLINRDSHSEISPPKTHEHRLSSHSKNDGRLNSDKKQVSFTPSIAIDTKAHKKVEEPPIKKSGQNQQPAVRNRLAISNKVYL